MNGLTFHCWLRLDNVSFHHCTSTFSLATYRRQLLQYEILFIILFENKFNFLMKQCNIF